jgi:hypothetical protein
MMLQHCSYSRIIHIEESAEKAGAGDNERRMKAELTELQAEVVRMEWCVEYS